MLWLLLLGCPAAAPHPGGPLDIACQDLPAGATFGAPARWTRVDPAFEEYTRWLAHSVFREDRAEHVVGDLTVYDGALYAGLGDFGLNTGSRFCPNREAACPYEDAPGHGMPVYRVEPGDSAATWDHVVREEAVARFVRLGDDLVIPGVDPTEGDAVVDCARRNAEPRCFDGGGRHPRFAQGSFHRLRDGKWSDDEDFDDALHVMDVTVAGTRWYAGGAAESEVSDSGAAVVWASDDDGRTWDLEYRRDDVGTTRITALVPLDDVVVALGFHPGDDQIVRLARLADGWVDLPALAPELRGSVTAELVDDGLALAWSPVEARVLRLEAGLPVSAPAAFLPDGAWVRDVHLLCRGDALVLAAVPAEEGTAQVVYRTSDLVTAVELARWTGGPDAFSVAWWDGALVYGGRGGWLLRSHAE